VKEEDFFYINNILHYRISDKESLSFDFLKGRLFNRLKRIEHESLIKKAIGKNKVKLKIFDATAGSLIDSIIFLKLGHRVVACEQSKILYRLLDDAILRAKYEYNFFENLSFINSDSAKIVDSHLDSDIFYFDPMFKDIKLNIKRSGTLQKIGNVLSLERLEDTSQQIFNQMLKKKYKKIIVKRPIKSNPLHEKINYQVKGKAIRYDIYIKT
jgi:16S rRNA (guanine1516-N2)-methyltransferase|tara:strand:+ start:366 stop:1001 length:636 start_codon:yes stop_codon:yes gene_type:complete